MKYLIKILCSLKSLLVSKTVPRLQSNEPFFQTLNALFFLHPFYLISAYFIVKILIYVVL